MGYGVGGKYSSEAGDVRATCSGVAIYKTRLDQDHGHGVMFPSIKLLKLNTPLCGRQKGERKRQETANRKGNMKREPPANPLRIAQAAQEAPCPCQCLGRLRAGAAGGLGPGFQLRQIHPDPEESGARVNGSPRGIGQVGSPLDSIHAGTRPACW